MAVFNTNFSKLRLLSNQEIIATINETSFIIKAPTIVELENYSFSFLIDILSQDMSELGKVIKGHEFNSHYELFSFIFAAEKPSTDVLKIGILLLEGLKAFIPDLSFKDKRMNIKNEFLNRKAFDELTDILFIMLDKKRIIIKEEDDDFTKREKAMKIKAQKIKQSKKESEGGKTIEDILAAIIYHFPQYKLEDLFKLNLYTIYYLFGKVGKITNYEVQKIAFGNGNFKKGQKLKHFIE